MIKNHKGLGGVRLLLLLTVLVVAAMGVYSYVGKQTRVQIENSGRTFSFDMGVPAETRTATEPDGTSEYYEVQLDEYKTKIVASAYIPEKVKAVKDIECIYDAFSVNILGAFHKVCDQKHVMFVANFNNGDQWYQVAVFPQDVKTELKKETVIQLLESIEVK